VKLLDTNICSAIIGGHPKAVATLATSQPDEIIVPTIVRAELYFGAYNGTKTKSTLAEIENFLAPLQSLEFSPQAAKTYGQLRADLKKRGKPIGPNDLIIASLALAHNLTLVTNNTKEFLMVKGLLLEDWL
jgi:tRNA(fMet)-specific endonuclease VapC